MSPEPLGLRLAALGHATAADLRRRLDPLGLHPRQYRVLAGVAGCGGCSQSALAADLRIPASRLVAIVDELEGRGLLERRPHPSDRRAHQLRLTPRGARLIARAAPLVDAQADDLLTGLDAADRTCLMHLLDRIEHRCCG